MEKITYRKTLDVHKNGTQFTLQGFQTADKMSRVIEISLMASGDAIDFPLEGIQAVMYVSTPSAETPSRIECDIKDNKIIYNVLPITEEGTTEMQLELIETFPGTSVLYSPKFAVEVSKSDGDVNDSDNSEILTVFEQTIQKADNAYNKAMTNFALSADGIITITYRDGSTYESDFLKRINIGDNAMLSESYAKGTAGVRQGEETDNAKYYSNVAKSEAINAKNIMADSKDVLEEVKLHGIYTSFSVDFDTGEIIYESPQYKFSINKETGELDAIGVSYSIEDNLIHVVESWLKEKGIEFPKFIDMENAHSNSIATLEETSHNYGNRIGALETNFASRVTPILLGGTGATTAEEALANLGGAPFDYVNQKVYVSQYTGTGTSDGKWGKDFPVRIHYGKKPKMIVIQGDGDYYNNVIMIYGSQKCSLFPQFGNSSAGRETLTCIWEEEYVSFYNAGSSLQLNTEGVTFRYVIYY